MNEAILIPAIVFFSIVAVVKIVADARTRNRLIEKGSADSKLQNLLGTSAELHALSSLKWGMVLVGIGLAALISRLFPYYLSDEVAFGLIFLFAGIGFLVYFPIAEWRMKKMRQKDNQPPS
jgi:hypothetical protein